MSDHDPDERTSGEDRQGRDVPPGGASPPAGQPADGAQRDRPQGGLAGDAPPGGRAPLHGQPDRQRTAAQAASGAADSPADAGRGKAAGPASGPGRKALKIVLWILAVLVALLVVALVILANFDWNRAKPWINRKVSAAIERPFAINGDLSVRWRRHPEAESGWRRLIPWPHIAAQDISVGDPAAFGRSGTPLAAQQRAALASIPATAADTALVRRLDLALDPLPLLGKQVRIPSLAVAGARLRLERDAQGRVNWTMPAKKDKQSKWKIDVRQLMLTNGNVHFIDAVRHADITADVASLPMRPTENKGAGYGIRWTLGGRVNQGAVSGGGMAGAVLALQDGGAPYPIKADMEAGKSRLAVEGTIARLRESADIDVRLTLAGRSLGLLYPLTGVVLPDTPQYTTSGRLRGSLRDNNSVWRYERFTGKIGNSDIGGTVEYHRGGERPLIKGTLATDTLNFADLAPVIGADSNASKRERGSDAVQPPGKVLPVERFRTERWNKMDAQVHWTANRIVRKKALPISKLSTRIDMKNGVLSLTPLNFGIAGGTLQSTIRLDGRGKTIKADIKAAARALQLQQLFPNFKVMQASIGEINGDVALSATGDSIATLLGSSNGEIKARIGSGAFSKMLLELAGLNLGNVVLTKLQGDRPIKLNCALTDFAVTDGLMRTRTAIVDTDVAVIRAAGTLNLDNEQMNLTVTPSTKALRIFTLRTPFFVRGPLKKPKVSVDMGKLALKAGSAAALGAVAAPAAALIPLINMGQPKQSECAAIPPQARNKPVAPPPGKTLRERLTGRPARR